MTSKQKQFFTTVVLASFGVSIISGLVAGSLAGYFFSKKFLSGGNIISSNLSPQEIKGSTQEEAVEKVVEEAGPAVVSIIISKDMPVMEQYWQEYDPFKEFRDFFGDPFGDLSPFKYQTPQYRQKGTEKIEIGGGTGFIVSQDGLILTNKHVAQDEKAEYTVLTNDGQKYPAKVLALDPIQDLAVLKIDRKDLPTLPFGDSDKVKVGQTVIAIGNALGEFRNTVSVGVVSGLKRSITASSGAGESEILEGMIQTDAAINPGNSGGPLLNLAGQVIGVNVAMASGAENIAFAIPVNIAKRDIVSFQASGKITYPFLGVRYTLITPALAEKNNLSVDYGALIIKGEQPDESAITPGSPAEKAGLAENDIILEIDGQKISEDNSLAKIIQSKNVGQQVTLKILRNGEEKVMRVVLGERE